MWLGGIGKQIGDFFFVDGCESVGLKKLLKETKNYLDTHSSHQKARR